MQILKDKLAKAVSYLPENPWKKEVKPCDEITKLKEELEKVQKDCDMVVTSCNHLIDINTALNIALGDAFRRNEALNQEAQILLKTIALQHNGEIVIRPDFIDVVTDPSNKLRLIIERQEDKSILIKIEEEEIEAIETEKGENN